MYKNSLWVGIISLLLSACATNKKQFSKKQLAYNAYVVEIDRIVPLYAPINSANVHDYNFLSKLYKIRIGSIDPRINRRIVCFNDQKINCTFTILSNKMFNSKIPTDAQHPILLLFQYIRGTDHENIQKLAVLVNNPDYHSTQGRFTIFREIRDRIDFLNKKYICIDRIKITPDHTKSELNDDFSNFKTISAIAERREYAIPTPTISLDREMVFPSSKSQFLKKIVNSSLGRILTSLYSKMMMKSKKSEILSSSSSIKDPFEISWTSSSTTLRSYTVQVGALSDVRLANQWTNDLKENFSVPGNVAPSGKLYRVQLGPFASRQQATELQLRLLSEKNQQSFITVFQSAYKTYENINNSS